MFNRYTVTELFDYVIFESLVYGHNQLNRKGPARRILKIPLAMLLSPVASDRPAITIIHSSAPPDNRQGAML